MTKIEIMTTLPSYQHPAVKTYPVICFAHLTNAMVQAEGDFKKAEEVGNLDALQLISFVLKVPDSKIVA